MVTNWEKCGLNSQRQIYFRVRGDLDDAADQAVEGGAPCDAAGVVVGRVAVTDRDDAVRPGDDGEGDVVRRRPARQAKHRRQVTTTTVR